MLELGSGCGLVGLLAAALGAHTLLTDLPSVLVRGCGLCCDTSRCATCAANHRSVTKQIGLSVHKDVEAIHESRIHCVSAGGEQDLLRSNTAANAGAIAHGTGAVDVAELTWGQLQLPAGWEQPDIVLAADLVCNNLHI